ncbi:MAG: TonB-dependent receptor [Gemmatimonadetes bacterium]|nr:TonB-dependent receptor [Gemmatimonadota bacterium]
MHVSIRGIAPRGFLVALLVALLAAPAAGQQVTGKVEGRVTDAQTGQPLAGAQVIVVGTRLGNITNQDGYYFINNVPAEVFDLQAQFIGYQSVTVTGQRVLAGQTVTVDFQLPTTAVALEPITVVGERNPLVPRDQVASKNIISAEVAQNLPVDNVRQLLRLQPGVVDHGLFKGFSIRGGRSGEEALYVDGVLLRNFNRGTSTLALAPTSVSEIDVLTGGFSAEFGEAQSGIINYVTRRGAQEWAGRVSFESDEMMPNKYSLGLNRLELNAGGPVFGPLSFFGGVTAQGQRSSNEGKLWRDVPIYVMDGIDTVVTVAATAGVAGASDQREVPIPKFTLYEQDGQIPFSNSDNYALDGKLDLSYGSGSRAYVSLKQLRSQGRSAFGAGQSQSYNGAAASGSRSTTRAAILGWTHNFVQRADNALALDLKLALTRDELLGGVLDPAWELDNRNPALGFTFDDFEFLVDEDDFPVDQTLVDMYLGNKDIRDPNTGQVIRQRAPFLNRTDLRLRQEFRLNPYGVATGFSLSGLPSSFSFAREEQVQVRATVDWQANRYHRVKFGGDYTDIDLVAASTSWINQDFGDVWVENPKRSSLFFQDRVDVGDVVIEGGVRWDRFDPNTNYPLVAGFYNIEDPATFTDAEVQNEVSPRVGVSFPVTVNSTFRLSYGHFVQVADLDEYYQGKNIDFFRFKNTNTNDVWGRPLKLAKTITFEFGFRQLLAPDFVLDVSAYNKDKLSDVAIRKLAWNDPTSPGVVNFLNTITNADFGNVRGVDVRLDRRWGRWLDVSLGYSFQDAKSTGTDPNTYTRLFARIERNSNQLLGLPPNPAQAIRSTEENRKHNVTGYFMLRLPNDWDGPAFLRNTGLFGVARLASGLPYSPLREVGIQVAQGPPTGVFEGDLKYDEISTNTTPWLREFDLKLQRGVRFGSRSAVVFLDARNVFDFKNKTRVFLSTGDIVDERIYGELVRGHQNLLGGGSPRAVDLSSLSSAGGGVTSEVDLIALRRAEQRFGDGDGTFTLTEQEKAFRSAVLFFSGPQDLVAQGRRLRLGFEVTF